MMRVQILAGKSHIENPRFRYTLDFLNAHPLISNRIFFAVDQLSEPDHLIYYGIESGANDFYIPTQNLFYNLENSENEPPESNAYRCGNQILTSVESRQNADRNLIEGKVFQYDILETIFFHISRHEEFFAKPKNLSEAGWLEEKQHFLIRNRLNQTPVVDHLIAAIAEVLLGSAFQINSTYSISHDIDILTRFTPFPKFIRSLFASIFHVRGLQHLLKCLRHYRRMLAGEVRDPYDSFQFLLRSRSSWQSKIVYLMSGGSSKYDNKYQLSDPKIRAVINEAILKGYKLGFHPSYNAHADLEMFANEKQSFLELVKINTSLNRQHWLRFDWTKTPQILTKNNVSIDSSIGYNHHVGFRCGTGFPYRLYDFSKEKSFQWIEQPLVFMDSSLIHYCRITRQCLKEVTHSFFSQNKANTHIEINFHNSNFDPTTDHGLQLETIYNQYIIPIVEK